MKAWDGLIIFLGTKDIEKCHEFYNGLLGFELYKDQGACRIYNIPGGGRIGFCSHIEVMHGERSPIITLLTDEVDIIYNNLKNNGTYMISIPNTNQRFNIYHFFAKDPDGYTVEIQRFLD